MSESEEMYLITIASIQEQSSAGPVPISRLAQELSVLPVSANQMVRKLDELGLVHYIPYKGAELTQTGADHARQVLRHRRLWEVFLVDKLALPISEADALACRLEHLTPEDVANRLDTYLEHPESSPQGLPIPKINTTHHLDRPERTAAMLEIGETAEITAVEAPDAVRNFLYDAGLRSGAKLTLLGQSEHAYLFSTAGGTLQLETGIAQSIQVNQPT
jgi:DtxR family Mn-dependent transcriptional regulator